MKVLEGRETVFAAEVNKLEYLYFEPERRTSERTPLIIFLHGFERKEQSLDLFRSYVECKLVANLPVTNVTVVAPRCPRNRSWEDVLLLLVDVLDGISKLANIDERRIYLTGFSLGALGIWKLAEKFKGQLAAIAPIAGGMGDIDYGMLAETPVWAFYGDRDEVVPQVDVTREINALKTYRSAKYTLLENKGHFICGYVYRETELLSWLLSQNRS